jgi:hypothetical protein
MADVNKIENWSGPYKSKKDAIEGIKMMCGTGYTALMWIIDAKVYINDGIDPDTGKPWSVKPQNGLASWTWIG